MSAAVGGARGGVTINAVGGARGRVTINTMDTDRAHFLTLLTIRPVTPIPLRMVTFRGRGEKLIYGEFMQITISSHLRQLTP